MQYQRIHNSYLVESLISQNRFTTRNHNKRRKKQTKTKQNANVSRTEKKSYNLPTTIMLSVSDKRKRNKVAREKPKKKL